MAHAGGRPTLYTQELALMICDKVATSTHGIKVLCKMYPEFPDQETINSWRFRHVEFANQYNAAKCFQAELIAEQLIDLCHVETHEDQWGITRVDAGMVARQKLLVDTTKWHASKLAPKIYGDKTASTVTVKHAENIKDLE